MDDTKRYLHESTGTENLEEVRELAIIIDTSRHSLDQLAMLLPNLETLNVSHSNVSILDLASAFPYLRELVVDECTLSDLTGLFMLSELKKFRARSNLLSDLSPFLECFSLEMVDLCDNSIADISSLYSLAHLPLTKLLLSDNPFWEQEHEEGYEGIERRLHELFPRVDQFTHRSQSPIAMHASLRLATPTAKLLKHSRYAIGTTTLFNSPISLLRRKRHLLREEATPTRAGH